MDEISNLFVKCLQGFIFSFRPISLTSPYRCTIKVLFYCLFSLLGIPLKIQLYEKNYQNVPCFPWCISIFSKLSHSDKILLFLLRCLPSANQNLGRLPRPSFRHKERGVTSLEEYKSHEIGSKTSAGSAFTVQIIFNCHVSHLDGFIHDVSHER